MTGRDNQANIRHDNLALIKTAKELDLLIFQQTELELTCQFDGTWSIATADLPTCEPKTCEPPLKVSPEGHGWEIWKNIVSDSDLMLAHTTFTMVCLEEDKTFFETVYEVTVSCEVDG